MLREFDGCSLAKTLIVFFDVFHTSLAQGMVKSFGMMGMVNHPSGWVLLSGWLASGHLTYCTSMETSATWSRTCLVVSLKSSVMTNFTLATQTLG